MRKISRQMAEQIVAREAGDMQMGFRNYYIDGEYLMENCGMFKDKRRAEIIEGTVLDGHLQVAGAELREELRKLRLPTPEGNMATLSHLAEDLGEVGDPRAEDVLEEALRFTEGKITEAGEWMADAIAVLPRVKRALALVAPKNPLL